MSARRLSGAMAFIAVVVSPLLLECSTVCQIGNQSDYAEGTCPVKLTSVLSQDPGGIYSECVTVRVGMRDEDFCQAPRIEILSTVKQSFRPTITKRKHKKKCDNKGQQHETRVRCGRGAVQLWPRRDAGAALWELVHECVQAEARSVVSASYSRASTSCSVSYTVPDPIPDFDLSVDHLSKSITVTAEPGDTVFARWCYQKSAAYCISGEHYRQITIDPSQSPSAVISIPYLLPCVCLQVYYTYTDARRHKKCPFQNQRLTDVGDVWLSSKVTLYESRLTWQSVCPASDLNISASLCWMQQDHLCTLTPNSTLQERGGGQHLVFSTAAVDKHPQMCVQFSSHGSHHISCPFQADPSSWEVHMGLGRQSVLLYLTSSVPATFSAQLCALQEGECTSMGGVQSATLDGDSTDMRINVPLYLAAEEPCVQVWQSDPFLHGRRILCPVYTHKRCGMYAVAILTIVIIATLFGIFIHRLTKSEAAGWLCIQKPVLLVFSSEQVAHVTAACALASVLQGELRATVLTALWARCLQTHPGARTGVADLGPLPWLYGQWEAVLKAEGKVLIVWSPEANKIYGKWREERKNRPKNERKKDDYSKADERHEKIKGKMQEDLRRSRKEQRKYNQNKAAGKQRRCNLCDDKDLYSQRAPSSVIGPVFMAALACLEVALQGLRGQGVVLVYFQGLCHSRDIPKAFRRIPRYCLPQDLSGLIQELGGMRQMHTGELGGNCCPRFLSKVLSIWLARQLANRLQTLLPQRTGRDMRGPGVASSPEILSEKSESRLKSPLVASTARPGTVHEQEPLCTSPWRPEEPTSQVSCV